MANTSLTSFVVRHGFLTRTIIIGVFSAALLLAGIIPMLKNVQDMSRKIGVKRKEVAELSDKVTILSGIDQNVLDERVRILDNALPPRKDVILYLTSVDGLSRELGLNFGGISLVPGVVTDNPDDTADNNKQMGLQILDTNIQIRGSEENIYNFLRLVEQITPLMQIKDVKVARNSPDSYNLTLKLGMLWAASNLDTIKGKVVLFDEKEEKYFQELNQYKRYEPVVIPVAGSESVGKLDLFAKTLTQE